MTGKTEGASDCLGERDIHVPLVGRRADARAASRRHKTRKRVDAAAAAAATRRPWRMYEHGWSCACVCEVCAEAWTRRGDE